MKLSNLVKKIKEEESSSRKMAKRAKNLMIIFGGIALSSFLYDDPGAGATIFFIGSGFALYDYKKYIDYNRQAEYIRNKYPGYFDKK